MTYLINYIFGSDSEKVKTKHILKVSDKCYEIIFINEGTIAFSKQMLIRRYVANITCKKNVLNDIFSLISLSEREKSLTATKFSDTS